MRKYTMLELCLYLKGLAGSDVRVLSPDQWNEVKAMVWSTEIEAPPLVPVTIDHNNPGLPCLGCGG